MKRTTLTALLFAIAALTSCQNPDQALAFGDRVLTYAETTGKVKPGQAQLGRDFVEIIATPKPGAKTVRNVQP